MEKVAAEKILPIYNFTMTNRFSLLKDIFDKGMFINKINITHGLHNKICTGRPTSQMTSIGSHLMPEINYEEETILPEISGPDLRKPKASNSEESRTPRKNLNGLLKLPCSAYAKRRTSMGTIVKHFN